MGVKENDSVICLWKGLAATSPSATHLPSCVALNGAAAKQSSIEASWDFSEL